MKQELILDIENRIGRIIAAIDGLSDLSSSMDVRGRKADFILSLGEAKDNLSTLHSLLGIETAPKAISSRVASASTILQELSALRNRVETVLGEEKQAKISFDAKGLLALVDATETAINRFQKEANGHCFR